MCGGVCTLGQLSTQPPWHVGGGEVPPLVYPLRLVLLKLYYEMRLIGSQTKDAYWLWFMIKLKE